MCYSEVSDFTSEFKFQKKFAGHFGEHKKLGRELNFQKFLTTGGLKNPKIRLIGGEETQNFAGKKANHVEDSQSRF